MSVPLATNWYIRPQNVSKVAKRKAYMTITMNAMKIVQMNFIPMMMVIIFVNV